MGQYIEPLKQTAAAPVRRHGVRALTPEREAEMVARWDAGEATVRELAEAFFVHKQTVRRILFERGRAARPAAVSKRGYHLSADQRARQSEAALRIWAERKAREARA